MLRNVFLITVAISASLVDNFCHSSSKFDNELAVGRKTKEIRKDGRHFSSISPTVMRFKRDDERDMQTTYREKKENICDILGSVNLTCKNGGTCTPRKMKSGRQRLPFTCSCLPGYKGRVCEEDINECDELPCSNGGTCLNEIGGYKCICPRSFTGTLCRTAFDLCSSGPCLNGGTCRMNGTAYKCLCLKYYEGLHCEKRKTSSCFNGCNCGTLPSSRTFNSRTSGEIPLAWPFLLRLYKGSKVECGATLIRLSEDLEKSDIILTAAHCLPGNDDSAFYVIPGSDWLYFKERR